jgi:predicted Zn-ribbon and HTH transcriptional regulator
MKQKPKSPVLPSSHTETARRRIMALLENQPVSARDISGAVGLAEKEVYPHLEHIRRSLQRERRRLIVLPSSCFGCGFVFHKRQRLTTPGKCPVCRSESISETFFSIG